MSLAPCFLVFDKEPDITSHDVVAMVRAVTGIKKVGHTGTLDPFARGVLPLALGSATRLIRFLDESQKVYDATIALGQATDTGDPTGTVIDERPVPPLERAQVEAVLQGFRGDRMQVPHRFSAVKVNGRRLYDYARKGEEVEAEPRPIHIYDAAVLSLEGASLRVLLTCSRGTYARGLADEISQALGTVGHLSALSRRRSGPFTIERAIGLPALSRIVADTEDWAHALRRQRGEERVPWLPRENVHRDLAAQRISILEALGHLPLLLVARGVADALLRGAAVPPPPTGHKPGQHYLIAFGEEALAVAEYQGGGKSAVLWRANQADA
ncbi:MAG: tRNA pseudouridine(55) synthase TruB [Pseudomonadota bacterium]